MVFIILLEMKNEVLTECLQSIKLWKGWISLNIMLILFYRTTIYVLKKNLEILHKKLFKGF